jgi:hypothetical protein
MPGTGPDAIRLSSAELAQLEKRAATYALPYFQVQRAKMILLAAEGLTNQLAPIWTTAVKPSVFWQKRFLPNASLAKAVALNRTI